MLFVSFSSKKQLTVMVGCFLEEKGSPFSDKKNQQLENDDLSEIWVT
jgi:hypothetical protein